MPNRSTHFTSKLRHPCALALVLCLALPQAWAQQEQQAGGNFNGHKLMELCGPLLRNSDSHLVAQGYCMGYITGVSQIGTLAYRIGYSSAQKRQPQTNRDICIPPNVSLVERIKAVIAYLYSHPEKLEKHQTVLTYQALRETYPCAKPE